MKDHGRASDFDERLERTGETRRAFEGLPDDDLRQLLSDAATGWGATRRVKIAGQPAFIKRVPVTALERANAWSTANLYEIPPYLNYPFGSPGMGVGRELHFARKATGWVEGGTCTAFPVLLHHRLIDRRGSADEREPFAGYTAYRGDDPGMNRYLADREAARCDLVLCYEDIPHTAADWITAHSSDASWIVDQVRATITFLRARDVVHFDIDMFNVLTDGKHAYVADYGLAMDGEFDLNDEERSFLTRNRHFDDGSLILGLGHQLYWMYRAARDDLRAQIESELALSNATFETAVRRLLAASDQFDQRGLLTTGSAMRDQLAKYRDVIQFMHQFFTSARAEWSPHTALDDDTLANLLNRAR
ncbi:MAG: hypothetical protein ABIW84_00830 [Ilumatobacteraceae bacterium]